MKKILKKESSEIINKFLVKLKKGIKTNTIVAEYFELVLKVPIYEKLDCAYLQTKDLKEGLLYEALTNSFFYVKSEKDGKISLSSLSKSIEDEFPEKVKEKLFWVCGNKQNTIISMQDFYEKFGIVKTKNNNL